MTSGAPLVHPRGFATSVGVHALCLGYMVASRNVVEYRKCGCWRFTHHWSVYGSCHGRVKAPTSAARATSSRVNGVSFYTRQLQM